MKKRVLAVAVVLCLVSLLFSGCKKVKPDNGSAGDSNTAVSSSPSNSSQASDGSVPSDNSENDGTSIEAGTEVGKNETSSSDMLSTPVTSTEPSSLAAPDPSDSSPMICLEAEKDSGKIVLKVSVRNNPGVASFSFRVNYDKNAVSPEKIENGLVSVTSNLQQTTELAGYVTAVYVNINGTNSDGTLFTVIFNARDGADSAAFSVASDKNSFVNADIKPVEFKTFGTEIKL